MRAEAAPRGAALLFVCFLLVACQARDGATPAGPVVFFDAAGNRMVIDQPPAAAGEPKPEAGMELAPIAQADARTDAPPPATTAIDETAYLPAEEFERQMEERSGNRFFMLPDGTGTYSAVTAATLAAGQPPPPPVVSGEGAPGQLLACPPGGEPLKYLLEVEDESRAHTLAFPAIDPSLKTRQRYAGYRLHIPPGVERVRLSGFHGKGGSPDVVVLQARAGVPLAVINNYATESIPENLFRYAMVRGSMPILAGGGKARELVVMEGGWARRVLPRECRPDQAGHKSTGGKVAIEFVGDNGGKKPVAAKQPRQVPADGSQPAAPAAGSDAAPAAVPDGGQPVETKVGQQAEQNVEQNVEQNAGQQAEQQAEQKVEQNAER